jgi:predicted nucleic acid-binding protein
VKVVLDTNVVLSALVFGGVPQTVLTACALSAGALIVVSGDKALLATDGYEGLRVMTVRAFKNEFLGSKP